MSTAYMECRDRVARFLATPDEPRRHGTVADGQLVATETWPAFCARRRVEVCAAVMRHGELARQQARADAERAVPVAQPAPRGNKRKRRRR